MNNSRLKWNIIHNKITKWSLPLINLRNSMIVNSEKNQTLYITAYILTIKAHIRARIKYVDL